MVRTHFLAILILDNLDSLSEEKSSFKRRVLKKIESLKKDFEQITNNGFEALNEEQASIHGDICLNFSNEFDEFYENFLKKYNLSDEGKP